MDRATERIAALCASLTNYERDRPDRVRFGLESMERLLARPDAPALPRTVVQVGGSKGKGTTARYLAAMARGSHGLRTGVYLSPHAETVLERVRIDDALVDEELLVREIEGVLAFARAERLQVSFFEVMTAAALGCFAARDVELAVLEVGLGGRLDATTAAPVDASVLTMVELEHTEILGNTIEAIAREKVMIFRPNGRAITGVDGVALEVAESRAAEVGATLRVHGRDFETVNVQTTASGELEVEMRTGDERGRVVVSDAPAFEANAVALAWACLRELGMGTGESLRIERPESPCCFELREPGPFLLDGAHTAESVDVLVREIDRRFESSRFALLFGAALGKRWRDMLERLAPQLDFAVLTELSGTASEGPAKMQAWLAERGVRAEIAPDAEAGLAVLRGYDGLRVVTGSFYLAGEIRALLRADPT